MLKSTFGLILMGCFHIGRAQIEGHDVSESYFVDKVIDCLDSKAM